MYQRVDADIDRLLCLKTVNKNVISKIRLRNVALARYTCIKLTAGFFDS